METIPKKDCIFASCDDNYFQKHGPAFINSCLSNDNNCHVHVINPSYESLEILKEFSSECGSNAIPGEFTYSTERVDTTQFSNFEEERSFYASNRFLTVSRFLNIVPGVRYMILDIDCVVRFPIVFSDLPFGLFPRKGNDLSMKVAAGILYIGHGGKPFLDNVVTNIQKIYRQNNKWIWFNDQVAIYYAYHDNRNVRHVAFNQNDMAWDFVDYPDATIWTGKGDRKNKSVLYVNERMKYE